MHAKVDYELQIIQLWSSRQEKDSRKKKQLQNKATYLLE
jgi:hypothetical protein